MSLEQGVRAEKRDAWRPIGERLFAGRDEIRKLRTQVEDLRARYRQVLEVTDDILLVTDRAARITEVSAPAREFFRLSEGAIVGRRLATLLAPGDAWRIQAAVREVGLRPAGGARQLRVRCPGAAASGWISLRVHAVGSESTALSWSVRDLSLEATDPSSRAEIERIAGDLARVSDQSARELRARDHFMAMLAHELRTPLNAILGYARMLREDKVRAEDRSKALATIEHSALAQARLVSDVMDAARIGEGKARLNRCPVDLAAVVERECFAARPAAALRGVSLRTPAGIRACVLEADGARLGQALSNLLSNAITFTPRGGTVTVGLEDEGSDVVLRVSDTGVGIAAEALPHLFERFYQAEEGPEARARGGLGLGLAIVRDVVEMHEGTVRAESAGRGRGATFVIRLPASTRRG